MRILNVAHFYRFYHRTNWQKFHCFKEKHMLFQFSKIWHLYVKTKWTSLDQINIHHSYSEILDFSIFEIEKKFFHQYLSLHYFICNWSTKDLGIRYDFSDWMNLKSCNQLQNCDNLEIFIDNFCSFLTKPDLYSLGGWHGQMLGDRAWRQHGHLQRPRVVGDLGQILQRPWWVVTCNVRLFLEF